MQVRRSQLRFRLGVAVCTVLLFAPYLGWPSTVIWASCYGALQGVEAVLFSRPAAICSRPRAVGALLLLISNSVVFGFLAVMWPLAAGQAGLVCASYMLGGAILNTVLTTQRCRSALIASLCPFVLYILVSAAAAWRLHVPLGMATAIGLAGLVMAASALKLWRQGSSSLETEAAARAELKAREAEASTQRAFLNAIIETVPSTLIVKDAVDRRILLANKAAETLLGVGRDAFIGRTDRDLCRPEEALAYAHSDEVALGADGPCVFDEVVRVDAGVREIRTTKVVVREAEAPKFLLVLCEDLTDEKRTAANLAAALERAEEANLTKSRFLANMSHEIRTPLNGVLGMTQVMATDDLSPRQRERLQVVRRSGEALLTLLNELLDLSKIEAGRLELEEAVFNPADVVSSVVASQEPDADLKGLQLELGLGAAPPVFYLGDPNRLGQVFLNLISNAVKFTAKGRIDVVLACRPDGISLTVDDTGIGMSPDQLERLFQPFVQAESSITRRFGGTGLGLAIAKQLVALMNGRIEVESTPGVGSRFAVHIPLAVAAGRAAATAPVEPGPVAGGAGDLRVLAAEDNDTNQLVLKTLLAHAGVDVTLVSDGAAAVAAWEQASWDLILIDVHMPIMDGLTAVGWIREREIALGRPRTPIIALTADVMTHQVARYRAAGLDDCVAKPIQAPLLFRALDRALNGEAEAATSATDQVIASAGAASSH